MIDAVLSYHMNPQTCGVAKFNQQLAQRLGVPMLNAMKQPVAYPLISVKNSEINDDQWPLEAMWYRQFDLFLHDVPRGLCRDECLRTARRVFAGNTEIASALRHLRLDITVAFCPSTISGTAHRGSYRVLAFGMAHKLNLPHFERLKEQLDREHPDYTIELSTAVHEGSPWDEALTESVAAMRGVFGPRLRVLGFLGDDALARLLEEVDAVAAYFTPALRANNTTYWAAVDAGKTIYTNRDELSPKEGERKTWDELLGLLRA